MRSKTPLALMEQLVMVLVFALSAAFCLRIFVLSNRISKEHEAMSQAVLQVQNTAELLKGSGDAWEKVLEAQQWQQEDGSWTLEYDKDWNPAIAADAVCYRAEIVEQESDVPGLCRIEICMLDVSRMKEHMVLFQIPVAWQEVSVHE